MQENCHRSKFGIVWWSIQILLTMQRTPFYSLAFLHGNVGKNCEIATIFERFPGLAAFAISTEQGNVRVHSGELTRGERVGYSPTSLVA